MFPLRYNTASQEVPLLPFVDATDGKTAEAGLTIANTDIKIWKRGATSLVNKNSGGATNMGSTNAYYTTLDATDTNTVGPIYLMIDVAGALVVVFAGFVYTQAVYDKDFADNAQGQGKFVKP